MPIFKIDDKLLLFVHIPKAAGTSLETYLESKSSSFAFIDSPRFNQIKITHKWYKTSPQHLSGNSIDRLFHQPRFFDDAIAITREPISRCVSAFNYHKYVEGSINKAMSINFFIKYRLRACVGRTGMFDNHFMPMSFFLPKNINVSVFKLEDGMDKLIGYLSYKYHSIELNDEILNENSHKQFKSASWYNFQGRLLLVSQYILNMKPDDKINKESINILKEVYANDFISFDYDLDSYGMDRKT
jgi:hypothetical protein